ncbi:MAG: tRNA (guanosine(37)-N1)-methyltransferase TrmD [Chlamydiales bacterium]
MKIDILSLFPRYFDGLFEESILGRAVRRGLLEIRRVDIRDFAKDRHRTVDDRPYGGGPGMVLKAEPVVEALRSCKGERSHVVYLSPKGKRLTAAKARELASYDHLILLCGHYEGIDERALFEVDEEISIGDYVLSNGMLPAAVVVDTVARFIPSTLGHEEAAMQDSFEDGLLDCPHYTRPACFEGQYVPEVLLAGAHEEIAAWRRKAQLEKTRTVRPDLYMRYLGADEEGVMEDGAMMDVTLVVGDLKRSLKLYNKKMGFPLLAQEKRRASLDLGGSVLSLVEGESPGPRQGTVMRLVIQKREPFELMASRLLRAKELVQEFDITDGQESSIVTFSDLEGYRWMLLNRKGEK